MQLFSMILAVSMMGLIRDMAVVLRNIIMIIAMRAIYHLMSNLIILSIIMIRMMLLVCQRSGNCLIVNVAYYCIKFLRMLTVWIVFVLVQMLWMKSFSGLKKRVDLSNFQKNSYKKAVNMNRKITRN